MGCGFDIGVTDTHVVGHGDIMAKKWYVVHAYSGFEKSVKRTLAERIERAGMQDLFGQILVPVEEVVEEAAADPFDIAVPDAVVEEEVPAVTEE